MSTNANLLGIAAIEAYVPERHESNWDKIGGFGLSEDFIRDKIGTEFAARKQADEETSDMCVRAFQVLEAKHSLQKDAIDCVVVVTQNPDGDGLPHTSAIVHGKLGLSDGCAAFDISLGCSGYVYGLAIIRSFMEANGLKCGLLFTADPYSKIINPTDKNTALLFGDAATVTLISSDAILLSRAFECGTRGREGDALICKNKILTMNGRAVFNFSAVEVPLQIQRLLGKAGLTLGDVDLVLLHQGSRFILDTIGRRLGLGRDQLPSNISSHGNTVSSSIPLLLSNYLENTACKRIVISGFGVGLSWASAILERKQ